MRLRVLAALLCSVVLLIVAAVPAAGAPPQPPPTETAGNSLSYPAIWAEGTGLTLQGTLEGSSLAGAHTTLSDGTIWYHQQDPLNVWQAENVDGTAGTPVTVDRVDWADDLESMDWALGSKIRAEVVLYHAATMHGFPMTWLSGSGVTEMWGTKEGTCTKWDTTDPTLCVAHSGVLTEGTYATVYSNTGRLTIQKVASDPTASSPTDIVWSSSLQRWVKVTTLEDGTELTTVLPTFFSHGVWETYATGTKPSDKFTSEINLPGKAIYGSTWDTAKATDGIGLYRLTFSLDPNSTRTPNVAFLAGTGVTPPAKADDPLADQYAAPPSESAVHVPVVSPKDGGYNLTYIDVGIKSSRGGSGKPN